MTKGRVRPAAMIRIDDPAEFARLVSRAISRKHRSTRAAAKAIGLKQPHLHRLARGEHRESGVDTIRRVRRLIPASDQEAFDRTILSSKGRELLEQGYHAWCLERVQRTLVRDTPSWMRW